MTRNAALLALSIVLAAPGTASAPRRAPATADPATLLELSIPAMQRALAARRTTSRALIAAYLARIDATNARGPTINAFVTLNPRALADADALDVERRRTGARGPLHGIPIVIKDNFDTADLPTSGGARALATLQPRADAAVVAKLRAAGAIIIGKTTMMELASNIESVSSLTGYTRNPLDPTRSPGGSSSGTGAAVAARYAAAGMGTDTCGSVRVPAAFGGLYGLRETVGLSSRNGIMPLSVTEDTPGPIARTMADIAVMLDATVGTDTADPLTAQADRRRPRSYLTALTPKGLKGARIGIARKFFGDEAEDAAGAAVVAAAIARMRAAGATLVEVDAAPLSPIMKDTSAIALEFRDAIGEYLQRHDAPVRSLAELALTAHPRIADRLKDRAKPGPGRDSPQYAALMQRRAALLAATTALLDDNRLDALLYPVSLRAPFRNGSEPAGMFMCRLASSTQMPSLAIPAGRLPDGLPIGIELLGRRWDEARLLRLGAGWETVAR